MFEIILFLFFIIYFFIFFYNEINHNAHITCLDENKIVIPRIVINDEPTINEPTIDEPMVNSNINKNVLYKHSKNNKNNRRNGNKKR